MSSNYSEVENEQIFDVEVSHLDEKGVKLSLRVLVNGIILAPEPDDFEDEDFQEEQGYDENNEQDGEEEEQEEEEEDADQEEVEESSEESDGEDVSGVEEEEDYEPHDSNDGSVSIHELPFNDESVAEEEGENLEEYDSEEDDEEEEEGIELLKWSIVCDRPYYFGELEADNEHLFSKIQFADKEQHQFISSLSYSCPWTDSAMDLVEKLAMSDDELYEAFAIQDDGSSWLEFKRNIIATLYAVSH
jgi:hypothetical protein